MLFVGTLLDYGGFVLHRIIFLIQDFVEIHEITCPFYCKDVYFYYFTWTIRLSVVGFAACHVFRRL